MRKADYRKIADTYDVSRSISEQNLQRWLEIISEKVGCRKKVEFLDLGCGTGRFSIPIATKLKYSVFGADASEDMLSKARKKDSLPSVTWNLQNASSLSYPDESFDVVFMSHLLHHVGKPLTVVSECYRILKPGGIVINRYGSIEDIRNDPEHKFFPDIIGIDEARTPTVRQVERWFKLVEFRGVTSEKIVQRTFASATERFEKTKLKCTSALTLIRKSTFKQGLKTFQKYISENPKDLWLLVDKMTLTTGVKVVQ